MRKAFLVYAIADGQGVPQDHVEAAKWYRKGSHVVSQNC